MSNFEAKKPLINFHGIPQHDWEEFLYIHSAVLIKTYPHPLDADHWPTQTPPSTDSRDSKAIEVENDEPSRTMPAEFVLRRVQEI